jgi:farnesyl diphosphate synthase
VAGGRYLGLDADRLDRPAQPGAAHVERLQGMKTGALIRCACELGAILGAAGADARRGLEAYGERLALVFQLGDDLLAAKGDADPMDMAASGTDAAAHKVAALADEAVAALAPFARKGDVLREAVAFVAQREQREQAVGIRP